MREDRLNGAEWRIIELVLKLQKNKLIPPQPWDTMKTDGPNHRSNDQGFGGRWEILEQSFILDWNTDKPEQKTTITILMRGEIPLEDNGKQMVSLDAQRRWFAKFLEIEKVRKTEVVKIHSDDLMRMLELGVK